MIDPQGHVGDDLFRRYSTSRSIEEEDRLTAARIGFKQTRDVAFWPKADMKWTPRDVRFRG
jgi:hypothetical protein